MIASIKKFITENWNDLFRPNGKYSRKSWAWAVGLGLFFIHANYAVFMDTELLKTPGFIELLMLYVGMSGFWGVMQYMSKKNLPNQPTQPQSETV